MTASRAALRLLPVPAATWGAAAVTILVPLAAPAIALTLWAVSLAACTAFAVLRMRPARCRDGPERRHRRTAIGARAVAVLVLAVAGSAAAASHAAFAQPVRDGLAARALDGGRAVEVRADVTGKIERRADGTLAFDAIATRIIVGARATAVRAEIVVRIDPSGVDPLAALDAGATVVARGTVSPSRPGERAVAVLWATRGVEVVRAPAGAAAVTAGLRQRLVAAAATLPGAGAGLVPGLAVGDTSAVTPELDAAMKESSLSHLTAVSGANCALVVGIAFAVAAGLGASRGTRVAVGLVALVGFVLLVTPEPSVVRAAAMAAIAMIAVLLGRARVGIAVLSLSVTVLLAIDPWLATSLGFALSVAATASLLLFARPLASGLSRHLPQPLALVLAVPIAAQLACGPLLVLIAPQIPLYGVAANVLAGPAAPVATVLGLAACLAAPLPWLQSGLVALAWVPASWIAGTASTVADLPADSLPWFEGWSGAASLAAVSAAVGLLIAAPRRRTRGTVAVRALSSIVVAIVAGVVLGATTLQTVAGRLTLPRDWTVLACDVGQGDALLLRSAGAVALIDTGPDPEPLAACLARSGIDRVDLLVLTHFDLDHIGGVDAVRGRVGTVLHGPPDAAGGALVQTLAAGGARAVQASSGLAGSLGGARWRVLWPQRDSRAFPPGNDASVVVDVRGGGIPPTLLLGDLSASPQRAIEASGSLAAPYAIVKVAHHGSADQHAALYIAARPAVALVTVGQENDYGHPRHEILSVLESAGAQIARTDEEGMLALWSSRGTVSVWRERGG